MGASLAGSRVHTKHERSDRGTATLVDAPGFFWPERRRHGRDVRDTGQIARAVAPEGRLALNLL